MLSDCQEWGYIVQRRILRGAGEGGWHTMEHTLTDRHPYFESTPQESPLLPLKWKTYHLCECVSEVLAHLMEAIT